MPAGPHSVRPESSDTYGKKQSDQEKIRKRRPPLREVRQHEGRNQEVQAVLLQALLPGNRGTARVQQIQLMIMRKKILLIDNSKEVAFRVALLMNDEYSRSDLSYIETDLLIHTCSYKNGRIKERVLRNLLGEEKHDVIYNLKPTTEGAWLIGQIKEYMPDTKIAVISSKPNLEGYFSEISSSNAFAVEQRTSGDLPVNFRFSLYQAVNLFSD